MLVYISTYIYIYICVCVCVCVCVYIYRNFPPKAGYDTKSILNAESSRL